MPQLSPMMGFVFFLMVIALYFVFLSSMSKSTKKVESTVTTNDKIESNGFRSFNLWNGSMMPKL